VVQAPEFFHIKDDSPFFFRRLLRQSYLRVNEIMEKNENKKGEKDK
jgi:hypothetical protein